MNQVEVKRRQIESFAHLLGMAAVLFLGKYMGENGLAYFAAAYEMFSLSWILVGRDVADTLGKILRGKSARNRHKNSLEVRKFAMISQGLTGLFMSLVLAFCGSLAVAYVFHMPNGAFLAIVLAPALFFRTLESGILGYFQGQGSELPTALSSVLRQVFFAGFGLLFGNLFRRYGEKVSALLEQDQFIGMYGAIGVAAAIVVTELLLLLLLTILYRGTNRNVLEQTEGTRMIGSVGGMVRALYASMGGSILLGLLQRLPVWLGLVFLAMGNKSVDSGEVVTTADYVTAYGVYYGKYLVLAGALIFLMDVLLVPVAVRVHNCVRREDPRFAGTMFQAGFHAAVVFGLFFSVFLAAMGSQLAEFLCANEAALAENMFCYGSFLVLFGGVAGYFYRILWLMGKRRQLLGALGLMNLIFLLGALLFGNAAKLGVNSYVYAGVIAGAVLCAALGFLNFQLLQVGNDWVQSVGLPAGCACAVGLLCLFAGRALTPHFGAGVTILVCLAVSWVLYWGLLVLLRNFREQDLKYIPGGGLIRLLGQLLRVYASNV